MKIHEFNISTKKNETQTVRFLVRQNHPYPEITGDGGRMVWRNHAGLFSNYGRKPDGIGNSYQCLLLVPGITPPEDFNRTHLAGYESNPGTIKLRGKDLGEMSIEFGNNPDYPEIRLRGFDHASGGERDFIMSNICPELLRFIREHSAELREEAIAATKKRMVKELAETRAELRKLEEQIATAVF